MNDVIYNDMVELLNRKINTDKIKNKTIFITGINSLIGRYITYYLLFINEKLSLNLNIVGTVRDIKKAKMYFSKYLNQEYFTIIKSDITKKINYNKNIDYIIHTAGYASAYHIVNNPVDIIEANIVGTLNVLNFAKEKNVENVVFTSTREVYGKVDNKTLLNEECVGVLDHTNPRNCYPESKKMAENLIINYNKQFNVPYTILRIAHTYGPTMTLANDGRVMSDFLNYYLNNKNIVLKSDGKAKRAFCYVTDTVYGIILALLGDVNKIYNLSNETEPYEIKEVAKMIVDSDSNKKVKVEFENINQDLSKNGYNNIPVIALDTQKIQSIGWYPKVSLEEGIKRTINYFKVGEN